MQTEENAAATAEDPELVEAELVEEPDEAPAAAPELTEAEQLAAMQADLNEARDRNLRLRAEFDNFRKRSQRDLSEARRLGKMLAIEEILPVFDHFEMAMAAVNESADLKTLQQGMDMILAEFRRALEAMSVERVATVGEKFDPNLHEAMSSAASPDVPEGHVISEWKAGYMIGDRLIRPASVIVSSGAAE